MKRSPGPRNTAEVPPSTHHKLSMYARAASAAGVGLLALAHPAAAKIVYTPAKIPIVPNGGLVELDLNHDGINDFAFSNASGCTGRRAEGEWCWSTLRVAPAQNSNRVRVEGWGGVGLCAAARPRGKKIGPANEFQPGYSWLYMAKWLNNYSRHWQYCPWTEVKQGYLGLKFAIKGTTHFGWAHVDTKVITGYAYETVPNKPILTGQTKSVDESSGIEQPNPASLSTPAATPATLGALALGAFGLSIWRRKED
jgi:hypothetical protein